ncbi:MAG: hypothetical protein WAK69_15720, partial [Rhodoplanes sp.]
GRAPRGSRQLFQPVPVANEVGKTLRQFEHWAISSQLTNDWCRRRRMIKLCYHAFIGFDLDQLSARFRPALSVQFVSGSSHRSSPRLTIMAVG